MFEALEKSAFPTFDVSMTLDYFGVTIIFAPGMKMVEVTGKGDVLNAHELLVPEIIVSEPTGESYKLRAHDAISLSTVGNTKELPPLYSANN